ncbi:M23 family metallopeptidase [Alsobacter ponti]|uniref:M23 family metallopeptidase n=1 Tax=Alsobacter ponti TaxID=2962936 RepID=UPI00273A5FA6|nr:M23 family metallopeptidase [Alsobacter ponti]
MGLRLRPALLQSVPRLVFVCAIAGGAAACSSDTMRFGENPFSNPFASSSRFDPQQTASTTPPVNAAPTSPVTAQPLPPPGQVSSSALPPLAPAASAPATRVAAVPAVTPPLGSAKGWTAQGGSTVTVGAADSVKTLANRYGVPEQAIRSANGLAANAQVSPGSQVVIPIYNASAAAAPTAVATAPSAPPAGKGRMQLVKGAEPAGKASAPAQQVAKPEAVKPASKTAAVPATTAQPAAAKKPEVAKAADAPVKTAKVEVAEPAKSAAKTAATPAAAPAAAPEETTSSIATATKSSAEFRWPAKGRVITGFGNKGGGSNDGINIALPEGTPVKAAEGGVVAYAGNELKGYGNLVLIRHPDGWVTAYAHNGDIKVKRGDTVTRGQTIASSGQSGNVSSPQLHFEIRKGSTPVDPMPHLSGQ